MIQNEVLNTIYKRRSTRSFITEPIEEIKLQTILNAAIWAPSGSNCQSWLFTAIQNKDKLLKLNKLVREGLNRWSPEDDYPAKTAVKNSSKNESYNFYYHAPVLLIASNKVNYENGMADCALGLENIFLAAESIELGSCYVNQLHWLQDDENIRQYLFELGIPKEHQICASAAIGYIDKRSKALERKPNTINIVC